jgi:glycosyltransferase involved in cell wall biosynthesis
MRVALVHDYLTQLGGAERVLLALMELFPEAPVFTLVYDSAGMRGSIDESRLRTSFLQHWPGVRRYHRLFPLLMPLAAEQFDFREYDLVLSDSHSFGKGVVTGPHTMHISYCFTPTRYVWDDSHRYVREFSQSNFFQRLAPAALSYIRLWDYFAAQRVDEYLTLSKYVARRIKKYYRREAVVIPPPVEIERFTPQAGVGEYYLVVSRLVPYKRIDLAIAACERLGRPLWVVGTGPEEKFLKRRAGRWTKFLGFVSEEKLPQIYAGAKALLFPQEEDFGITPLEAAAAGRPTIAYGAGGALETIIENRTGLFFHQQSALSLMRAITKFETGHWDSVRIRQQAEKFKKKNFMEKITKIVAQRREKYQRGSESRRREYAP